MTTMLKKKDWSAHTRRALTATEIVANLAKIEGWSLSGDGAQVAIEKTYHFAFADFEPDIVQYLLFAVVFRKIGNAD